MLRCPREVDALLPALKSDSLWIAKGPHVYWNIAADDRTTRHAQDIFDDIAGECVVAMYFHKITERAKDAIDGGWSNVSEPHNPKTLEKWPSRTSTEMWIALISIDSVSKRSGTLCI